MNTCIIIPARFKSSRFPGKPLAKICDKPMVIWVAEICEKAIGKEHVFVASDDASITQCVSSYGFKCIQTSPNCLTGTDRVAEASMKLDYEFVINVQGDEPLVSPNDIKRFLDSISKDSGSSVFNGFAYLSSFDDCSSFNTPKIVCDLNNNLLFISRNPIPISKSGIPLDVSKLKKQVCIYAYTQDQLRVFYEYGAKTPLEEIEDIEILRFLELGINVKMIQCQSSSIAVDIPSDIQLVENVISTTFNS